jgi:hypothetical protein
MIKNTARTADFKTPEFLPFSENISPDAEYWYVAHLYKSSPNADILDVPSQPTTRIISDADRIVSIRLADGRSNTYAILGGVPADSRAREIGLLIYEA